MNKAAVLARKDLGSFFRSWFGILLFIFFFLASGILFSMLVLNYGKLSAEVLAGRTPAIEGVRLTHFIFGSFFLNLGLVMVFLVPLITMRSFAEERNRQTLELLFTYPLSDTEIVWGKYQALLGFSALLILPTLGYVALLQTFGASIDLGPVLCCYLGLFLLIAAFSAMGLFISSLTENPVISSLTTFCFLLLLWGLEWMQSLSDGRWFGILNQISPLGHYREFTFGIVDLGHVAYFLFFALYFLFLTLRSVESRHWKSP
ncbi:MAG: ABC transporter permease [Candidatus Omnitrophota bacterium]